MVDELIELLKKKHGKDLNLKEDVYYLFLKGGLFSLYYDEDEKTVKVGVEFLPEDNTFVYFDEQELNSLIL
jgi:type IV secretory pathway VirB4 component